MVDVPPCHCTAGDSTTPDHALSCNRNAGEASMRHNYWVSAWRHAIHRAGCASSVEPQYSSLAAAGAQGAAGLRRGDNLTVWPDGRVRVMDCVVTHPVAASLCSRCRRSCRIHGSEGGAAEAASLRGVWGGLRLRLHPTHRGVVWPHGLRRLAFPFGAWRLGGRGGGTGCPRLPSYVASAGSSAVLCARATRACTTSPSLVSP